MNKGLLVTAIVFCLGIVGYVFYDSSSNEIEKKEEQSVNELLGKPLKKD